MTQPSYSELAVARAALDVAAQPIFQSLVDERGGDAALSTAHRSILHKIARLLASQSAAPEIASALAKLLEMVPPAQPQPSRPLPSMAEIAAGDLKWDLSRLDDAQLDQLEVLHAVACGVAQPVRDPRRSAALSLAALLNAAERAGQLGDVEGDSELRAGVLNAFHDLLAPCIPYELFCGVGVDLRMGELEAENARLRAELDTPSRAKRVSAPTDNVVALRPSVLSPDVRETISMAAGYAKVLAGGQQPDVFDEHGRRLDDDGRPSSRRRD